MAVAKLPFEPYFSLAGLHAASDILMFRISYLHNLHSAVFSSGYISANIKTV